MQVPFRNGLLQYTCVGGNINIPSFLTRTSFLGGYKINVRVDGVSLMGTISHLQKEYIISVNTTVSDAWTFSDNNTHYLFLGYDTKGQITYKDSIVSPSYGSAEPVPEQVPQFFFNTSQNCWKEWVGGFWQVVDLLYVGNCSETAIVHNIRGTYGGQNLAYQSGYPVYSPSGKAILLSDKTFLTTADDIVTKDWSVSTTKLEYSLMLYETNQNVGAYTCMKMMPSGKLSVATPQDVGEYFLCLTLSSSLANQLVDVTHNGIVSNSSWNWQFIGAHVYLGITGELTDQNPYLANMTTINALPVARVLSKDSIVFNPPFVPLTITSIQGNTVILLEGDNISIVENGDEFTVSLQDSPALSGLPTTPTPATNTNNTQIANTAFVKQSIDNFYNNSLLGRIWKWTPNTVYYAARVVSATDSAPDVIFYDNQLFVVIQDFTSSTTFSEKSGASVVLSKLTADTDVDYLELMMQANAPLSLNQEIGSYLCVRDFVIDKQHTFPNARLGSIATVHKALCNSSITSNNVVSIKRTNALGVVDSIGTITFTAGNTNNIGTIGTFSFNDTIGSSPNFTLTFSKGDILSMVLTTKSGDITWLKINMLGTYVKFISPWFT